MARLARFMPAGIPAHIIQRGNNRQACFGSDEDLAAYAEWLKIYSKKYEVDIHAWVFMTNHVHLLCTPKREGAVGRMMQSLGRKYVRYFNHQYQRSGTLWEGRYKSCLVQAERYLIEVYRYIELNPVRANMVADPASYRWSSYQVNALGKNSELCTPHDEYLALGAADSERLERYRALFAHHVDDDLIADIRSNTNKGMAVGHDHFKEQLSKLSGRRLVSMKVGRPVGWRKIKE